MMKQRLLFFVGLLLAIFIVEMSYAQTDNGRTVHKVKKKETIFGIARQYGLSIQELIDANPEMKSPGYELKKDAYIVIPSPKKVEPVVETKEPVKPEPVETELPLDKRPIRLGVMLPLHDINGDGRRMVEYYRGVLMACDSLKKLGISVDVHAWNTAENCDIRQVLADKSAARCDIIIGPLYSKQMPALSEFVAKHDIRLVIPFSINAPEIQTNQNIYQIYQAPSQINEQVIDQFVKRFSGYHPVIIDCNDTTSTKGTFTFGLRRKLESLGIEYGITNLKSSESIFLKSFSTVQPNVVVLNTGRSPELNVAIAKLSGMTATQPAVKVTLLGYTEWLLYTKYQLDNFYKFDVYIPAAFHYNPLKSNTLRLDQLYRWNFHQDMMSSLPRFAITGFDHTMHFLQGLHRYGKNFSGNSRPVYDTPVQTPLKFMRVGNGGWCNNSLLFMHYLPEHRVETIPF